MTDLIMWDAVDVSQIPAGAAAVAGYVNGNWVTYPQLTRQFPGAHVLSITITADADADCLDIEQLDATPAQAPAWVRRQLARGAYRPCLYASAGIMGQVLSALGAAGITRGQVRLWSAHYAGAHICGPGSCGATAEVMDGTQWTSSALGRDLDESLLDTAFFATAPEDTVMVIVLDQLLAGGPAVALPVPAGSTSLLLLADPGYSAGTVLHSVAPRLRVGTTPPWQVREAAPAWDAPVSVSLPQGTQRVTLARLDAGNVPVTASFS